MKHQKKQNGCCNDISMDNTTHHKMMMNDYWKRFWISIFLTIPILLLSPLVQNVFNYNISFEYDKYILFAFSSIIFFYGGWPFLKGLKEELSQKNPGMMTLIGIAISVAYFYSTAVVFGLKGKFFFWELATLIDVMLIGHWLEMRSVISASSALEKLAKLLPDTAHKINNDKVEDIQTDKLKKGDIIFVKSGEKVPIDGILLHHSALVNQSQITGESKPKRKKIDDEIFGGSLNKSDTFEMKVKNTADKTYISKVIKLVKEAQLHKSKTQKIADKAAMWLAIIGISAGLITLIVWLVLQNDLAFSLERMATVMVITCPHALGLAIPLVIAVSTSVAANNGLIIKNRTAFENANKISVMVFDKTGTLTKGKFDIKTIESLDKNYSEDKILEFSGSIEEKSEHAIGKTIYEKFIKSRKRKKAVRNYKVLKGEGVSATIDGDDVKLVSQQYLKKNNIKFYKDNNIATKVYLVVNDKLVGKILLEDSIRKGSADAVNLLKEMNIKTYMITGDNKQIAKKVSDELGLDDYYAQVLPHEKQQKIKQLQSKGEFVAMAGDGINDAPALAQADVGIAVGSGTDVAAETSDIILANNDPKDILKVINFGRKTYDKMIQNLWWAAGYNIIAIPLAAGVLFSFGILISPALGAALMSASTVIVAINAKMLHI